MLMCMTSHALLKLVPAAGIRFPADLFQVPNWLGVPSDVNIHTEYLAVTSRRAMISQKRIQ